MAHRRPVGAALAALALAACATARDRPPFPPVHYRGESGALPSGMRVATFELRSVVLFSLTASYRSGSADDPPGQEGLAALTARVVARLGGGGGDRLTHSQRLLAAGVRFSQRVDRDTTDFIASGPPDRLAAVLAVEADRLRHPLRGVTAEDFVRERDLYAEELAEKGLALSEQAGGQWLLETALGGSGYARPPAGTAASVRRLTLDDVRALARQRFTPAHLVLAITTPAPGAYRQAVAAFGTLATGDFQEVPGWARAVRPVEIPSFPLVAAATNAEEALRSRSGPVGGPQLWFGWLLPGEASSDSARASAGAELARMLVVQAAWKARRAVLVRPLTLRAYGFTLAAFRVEVENDEEAQEILRALRRLDAPGASGSRLEAAVHRERLLLSEYLHLEQPDVSFLARQVRLGDEVDPLAAWRQKVSAGLATGFEEWVERWLDPGRAVALLVVPEKGREEPRAVEVPEAQARWATTSPMEPRLPPGRYDADDVARPPGLDAAKRSRLANGLEVVVFRRAGFPRVEGRLVVRTRPNGTPDVLAALPRLALVAASSRGLSSSTCPFPGTDFLDGGIVASADGPSNRLEDVIEQLACWAGDLKADDRVLDHARAILERLSTASRATPEFAVGRAACDRTIPGCTSWDDRAALDAIDKDHANAWLEAELRPDRATLILAGDLEPGPKLLGAVEKAFGGWRVRRQAAPAPAAAPDPLPRASAVLLGHRKGAKTASISVWLRAPALGERDLAAEQAFGREIGRLLDRNRGPSAAREVHVLQLDRLTGPSLVVLETRSKTEEAVGTLRRMLEVLGGTAVAPVGTGVLGLLRWDLAIDFPFRFATVDDVADRLADLAEQNRPNDFWERYPDSLVSLDGARIQAVARSFSVGREVVAIVGDREVLEPQLRAAGFKVEVVEPAAAKK